MQGIQHREMREHVPGIGGLLFHVSRHVRTYRTNRLISNAIKWLAGRWLPLLVACSAVATLWATACQSSASDGLNGSVKIDGSSTVYPITEAVAEDFLGEQPRVRVTVGVSGTGGGFKKFILGETDINNASRPINEVEEELALENGVQYLEISVALDGIAIMAHPDNAFLETLTMEELKLIWEPGSTVTTWSDIRPEWPDREISLYGPGTDSGTFDYFTEVVVGESGATRPDFSASEDDNVLIWGISGDMDSLGYVGYAYFIENKDAVKLVAIDSGQGPIKPNAVTVNDGTYEPLTRPLYIYVSEASLAQPQVMEFVRYYLTSAPHLVGQVGYVPLREAAYQELLGDIEKAATQSP